MLVSAGVSTGFEEMIKGANCTESHPPQRPCGSFWIYDLDDVEASLPWVISNRNRWKTSSACQDTPLDGVSTVQDLAASYQYTRDAPLGKSKGTRRKCQVAAFQVQITLFGLTEATVYDHIYCFAEDDEVDGFLAESQWRSKEHVKAAKASGRHRTRCITTQAMLQRERSPADSSVP